MIKNLIDWHPIRWIFLVLGTALALFSYSKNDAAIGMLSVFVIYQAIFNVGCIQMCYAWQRRKDKVEADGSNSDEITYEEIL